MRENQNTGLFIDSSLAEKMRLGVLIQSEVEVTFDRGEDLDRAISETEDEMRTMYVGRMPSEIPGLKYARKLYRSIGEDPTRMRPASEALLRRVLKGQKIPVINSAVDSANLSSLRHLIPVGLYDLDKIDGDAFVRIGKMDEKYQRIGKGEMNLNGRIGLFDVKGGFGNPTGDSKRTSVGEETKSILFTAFFPADYNPIDIADMIEASGKFLTRYTGGKTIPLGEKGYMAG